MRISDWSSDVCSSDLQPCAAIAPCQYSTSQREIETDGDSSRPPSGEAPRSAASTSSKVNQRASSSSSPTCGSSGPASAKKPSLSDEGNGHGCEAEREGVVEGKSEAVGVVPGGRRILQ